MHQNIYARRQEMGDALEMQMNFPERISKKKWLAAWLHLCF
jgi:hypothetical protein